jgi:hypothetical protein
VGKQTHVPLIIKDKRNKPPMNNRLTALVKHVAEFCEAGLKACHYVKSSIFGEFAPLAVGRSWHLNAHCCPILVTNLLRVNPLSSPFINDKLILS